MLSLSITLVVMVIEIVGGFLTNSISLLSDSGHMFTHAFATGMGLVAVLIARKPPCHHRTYGLYRGEILAAFLNGLVLLFVVSIMVFEAVMRLFQPEEVLSIQMLIIAIIGLIVNLASMGILFGGRKGDLNIKSIFLHLLTDSIASVGVIIVAIIIFLTRGLLTILDPIVGLAIAAVIVIWAYGILKESSKILLEMAPSGLNMDVICEDLKKKFPEIEEVFHVHLWTITSNMLVFSGHIKLKNPDAPFKDQEALTVRVEEYLFEKFNIIESTIQMDSEVETEVCKFIL